MRVVTGGGVPYIDVLAEKEACAALDALRLYVVVPYKGRYLRGHIAITDGGEWETYYEESDLERAVPHCRVFLDGDGDTVLMVPLGGFRPASVQGALN